MDSLYTDSLYLIAMSGSPYTTRRIRIRYARARYIRAAVGSLHTRSQYAG